LQSAGNLTLNRVGKKLKIGITYDLRDDYLKEGYSLEETAEFDLPDTIEAIEKIILLYRENSLFWIHSGPEKVPEVLIADLVSTSILGKIKQ